MGQLFAVLIVFLLISLLGRFKINLSYILLIACGVLALLSGIGLQAAWQSLTKTFTDFSSLNTILSIMMVSILGGLMKHYKILDKIVSSIYKIIQNKKIILMVLPALVGVLIIPGGALLSAPFINEMGEEMNLQAPRRAAINLVFRHIAMFIMPYSTGLLFISAALPEINISKLILLNMFYVVPLILSGYFLFIRNIEYSNKVKTKFSGKNLLNLLLYTSPIYICVIINGLTGLPFSGALIFSVLAVYFLSDKKDFFIQLIKSINYNTVMMVAAILIMKEIILNMEDLLILFNTMFNAESSMLKVLLIFLISSVFFGIVTGNQTAALAIILPMISLLDVSLDMIYIYTYFSFACTYSGYFFSPIHLCQAFTLQCMNVATIDLYKEYRVYVPLSFIILFASVYLMKFIFV